MADQLELVSAKAQTLAAELRSAAPSDPSYPSQVAEYLRDLYASLERTVIADDGQPDRWSRA